MDTEKVICKKCGFCFCLDKKPEWADTFDGCYTPSYCEKNQENPNNKNKYIDQHLVTDAE